MVGQQGKVTFATANFPTSFVGLKEVSVTITGAELGVVESTINLLFDDLCLSIYG